MAKRAKKRGTPPRAKKRPSVRKQVALTRPVTRVEVVQPPAQLEPIPDNRRLEAGSAMIGELGLVEIKFTEAEERVLSEAVDETRVLVKPNGAPYLPHAEYTRWLNRALGRGAWSLVPVGTPGLANKTVVCPYVLYIHGRPVAFAQGEQEYFESNRSQSYGDALESTVASALRRCTKHLGIGLELWDRDWLNAWLAKYAVKVKVKERDGKTAIRWRREKDPRLPYEMGRAGSDEEQERYVREGADTGTGERWTESSSSPEGPYRRQAPAPSSADAHRHTHGAAGEKITQKQRQRLWVIIRNSGRDESEVGAWLKRVLKIDDTRDITRAQYDNVCRAIESPADLPERI